MSDALMQDRRVEQTFDDVVVAASFAGGTAAFALGDGSLQLARFAGPWRRVEAHDGPVLGLAAAGLGWVSGGDDGRFCRVSAEGTVHELAAFGSRWVEQVAAFTDPKTELLACSVGKLVHLFAAGARVKTLEHPSSVTGLAFDAKGKRIAASHYNGCSLWFVGAKADTPRRLEWKGSHTGIALHPGGEATVTAMQENALHGWRLPDGQHMRMSGYPTKTESLSFSRNGRWLASSGADSVVLWPFFGGGPMGKVPLELAGGDGMLCTRVSFQRDDLVAAGFADGLVVVAEVSTERILPVLMPGHGAVTALAWSADGTVLAVGTEGGLAALFDFSQH